MATVQTYSLKKDGDKYLSKNFRVREFRCKDGSDTIKVCQETINVLQAVRDYFGRPVTINSAYRTPSHNKAVGGASSSQHVVGTACDIKVAGIPPEAVAGYLEANFAVHGIGLYNSSKYGYFVHVDSRGRKTYWHNTSSNVVTSFKQGTKYRQYKAVTQSTAQLTVQSVVQPSTKPVVPQKTGQEDTMTDREIYEAVQRHAKTLPVPEWAKAELQKAIDMGITDGSEPMALIPRYQAAIMAARAKKAD